MGMPVQLRQRHGNGRAVVAGIALQAPPAYPPAAPVLDIGRMDEVCVKCRARHDETPGTH
jgi:hypothetical protein